MQEFINLYKTNKKALLSKLIAPLVLSAIMFFILSICKRIMFNETINILFVVFGILQLLIALFMGFLFAMYSLEERAKREAELKENFDRSHPRK